MRASFATLRARSSSRRRTRPGPRAADRRPPPAPERGRARARRRDLDHRPVDRDHRDRRLLRLRHPVSPTSRRSAAWSRTRRRASAAPRRRGGCTRSRRSRSGCCSSDQLRRRHARRRPRPGATRVIAYVVRRLLLAVSIVWAVSFGAFVAFGLSFDPTTSSTSAAAPMQDSSGRRRHALPPARPDPRALLVLVLGTFPPRVRAQRPSGLRHGAIDPTLWHAAGVTAQLHRGRARAHRGLRASWPASSPPGPPAARSTGSPRSSPTSPGRCRRSCRGPPHPLARPDAAGFRPGEPAAASSGWIRWMALPAVALSLGLVGLYSRYVRTETLARCTDRTPTSRARRV